MAHETEAWPVTEEHIYPQGTPASATGDFDEIRELARVAAHEAAIDVLTMGVVDGLTVRTARVYAYSLAAIERCPACCRRLPASLPLSGHGLDIAVLIHASHRLAESYIPETVA